MFTWFCLVAAVMFLFLFVIWSKSNLFNFFLKFMWLLMAVWAIVCSLKLLGFLS